MAKKSKKELALVKPDCGCALWDLHGNCCKLSNAIKMAEHDSKYIAYLHETIARLSKEKK